MVLPSVQGPAPRPASESAWGRQPGRRPAGDPVPVGSGPAPRATAALRSIPPRPAGPAGPDAHRTADPPSAATGRTRCSDSTESCARSTASRCARTRSRTCGNSPVPAPGSARSCGGGHAPCSRAAAPAPARRSARRRSPVPGSRSTSRAAVRGAHCRDAERRRPSAASALRASGGPLPGLSASSRSRPCRDRPVAQHLPHRRGPPAGPRPCEWPRLAR